MRSMMAQSTYTLLEFYAKQKTRMTPPRTENKKRSLPITTGSILLLWFSSATAAQTKTHNKQQREPATNSQQEDAFHGQTGPKGHAGGSSRPAPRAAAASLASLRPGPPPPPQAVWAIMATTGS
mmetsp:Transcript_56893/g.83268  ORF Transcript_56893/g.83268 Transcript_56893/m.83268 type:complete len:124 (+) Transcript_56893:395-766(+)